MPVKRMILSLLVCSTLLFWGCGKGGMPNDNSAVASSTDFVDVYTEDEEEWDDGGLVQATASAGAEDPVAAACDFTTGNGYGYINLSGEWVISPQYLEAYPFVDNVATVKTWENRWKLIDKSNRTIAEFPEGIEVDVSSEEDFVGFTSYTSTIYDGRIILIDNTGEDALYGVADTDGNIVVKPQYADINAYSEGLAVVQLELENGGKRYSYLDKTGYIAIDAYLSTASPFRDGLAWVQAYDLETDMATQNGFIDQNGNFIITYHQYEVAGGHAYEGYYGRYSNFYNGVAAAKVAWADTSITGPDKTAYCLGLIDRSGNILARLEGYGVIDYGLRRMEFSEGLCPFYGEYDAQNDMYATGFMDTAGNIVIAPQTEWKLDASNFSEGYCVVKIGGKYGYIDASGGVVIPAEFDYARDFTCGFAAVRLNSFTWAYIDTSGNTVFEDLGSLSGAFPFTE